MKKRVFVACSLCVSFSMMKKELKALNVANSLSYCEKDVRTARCRLSTSIFSSQNITLGSIVHFRLSMQQGSFEVLCTAWPITSQETADILLDDSVFRGNKFAWVFSSCEV
jgi:hypothetical protein